MILLRCSVVAAMAAGVSLIAACSTPQHGGPDAAAEAGPGEHVFCIEVEATGSRIGRARCAEYMVLSQEELEKIEQEMDIDQESGKMTMEEMRRVQNTLRSEDMRPQDDF